MEALSIFLATTKDVSYILLSHPFYSIVGTLFLTVGLLTFYCRLTLGVCNSDQDMTGKTVLITGASDGIGKETARDLARRNARVLLACRNLGKANKVAQEIMEDTGNHNLVLKALDLSSFDSVRKCARDVLRTEKELHVLINNAGIISSGKRETTEDGCEKVMQTNHLGHFLLTLLLLDLLKKSSPSRIINVSSAAYTHAKLDVDDLNNEKSEPLYNMRYYFNSKLANIYFTKELASRLSGTGVTVNAVHPGAVRTNVFSGRNGLLVALSKLGFLFLGKSSAEGAQTTIHAAVHPNLERTTGKYFGDCKEEKLQGIASSRAMARRLFENSEKIVGLTFQGGTI
ncbi:retinol dehydrogenase 12-like [Uloborus diversus]|uniref:retinol dehydrogenase 12-like n=1 Tax=Uloborus diversus TaxID=327109 RepID=UPI002408FB53|nr:retinol dehydrogenase 12-like [Uloborus diversus]